MLGEEMERRINAVGEAAAFESLRAFLSSAKPGSRFSVNSLSKALIPYSFRSTKSGLPTAKKAKALPATEYPRLHTLIVNVTHTLCDDISAMITKACEEVNSGASANPGLAARLQQVFPTEMPPRTTADAKFDMQCWLQGCLVSEAHGVRQSALC